MTTPYEELKSDLLIGSSEKTTEAEQRSELVARLKQGITRSVLGEPLLFRLDPDRPSHNSTTQNLRILHSGNIYLANLFVEKNATTVLRFEKHYEQINNIQLKGIGLISFASGLFFQALMEEGISQVHGLIRPHNRSSIAVRLKTEDLVRGGYFHTVVSSQKDTEGYHQVVSYIDPKLKRLPEPISLAEAQLNSIFSTA